MFIMLSSILLGVLRYKIFKFIISNSQKFQIHYLKFAKVKYSINIFNPEVQTRSNTQYT